MGRKLTRNAELGTRNRRAAAREPVPRSAFRVSRSFAPYRTNKLPDPLLPSLVAVTSAEPERSARTTTDWPDATSIRATVESLTLQNTARPDSGFPWASRGVAKKRVVSPTATTTVSGVTDTLATESGGGGGGGEEEARGPPRGPEGVWGGDGPPGDGGGGGGGRGQRLHHHQLGRAALAMAPGRDLGGAAPQGTQDERLPELRLDPRDARVGYAQLHMPVADEIPLGILQGGEETSAVAHGDGVGRRRDRHRCHGPGLAAWVRIRGRVRRRPEIRDQSVTRSDLVVARGSGDCRGGHAATEDVSHRASGEK